MSDAELNRPYTFPDGALEPDQDDCLAECDVCASQISQTRVVGTQSGLTLCVRCAAEVIRALQAELIAARRYAEPIPAKPVTLDELAEGRHVA